MFLTYVFESSCFTKCNISMDTSLPKMLRGKWFNDSKFGFAIQMTDKHCFTYLETLIGMKRMCHPPHKKAYLDDKVTVKVYFIKEIKAFFLAYIFF